MIPRPSLRADGFDNEGDDNTLTGGAELPDDLLPPADYPRDKFSTDQHGQSRGKFPPSTFRDYYPLYDPYGASPYHYVTYRTPGVAPIQGSVYDPYRYWPAGYGHYPVHQSVYNIPPGTSFELAPPRTQAGRSQMERFEVESITGRGIPHQVRNVSTGERFVVEHPTVASTVAYVPDPSYPYPGPIRERVVTAGRPRVANVISRSEPNIVHALRREPVGSTSSYTDGSTHTRSGPHFMNGVDYLDVSTRSRILNWLSSSPNQPIRLRPVSGPSGQIRQVPRERVRYPVYRSLGPQ